MFKVLCSTFLVSLVFIPLAQAEIDISLGAVQRYFLSDKKPFQTLKVSNNNKSKHFELEARFVLYTNLDDFEREGPESEEVHDHFLLAPKKFVLEPESSRSVRIVRTLPLDDKERVYGLSYRPTEVVAKKSKYEVPDSIQFGLNAQTTGGILVYVSPKDVDFNVTYKRDEKGVSFLNEGNITAELRRHDKYCYELEGENNCMALPGDRLSPGEIFYFKVSPEIPLVWTVRSYNKFRMKVVIPAFNE